jgi:mercuric ion transport protein
MKTYLEKIGSFGGVIAAAACPVCFPKLALIGALFGLGALGAYESQLFIAAQVLVAVAVLGHALAYLQHRKGWLLGLAISSGVAVFGGLYLLRSEAMIYAGFAGLVVTSATDYWARFRRTPAPSWRSPPAKAG